MRINRLRNLSILFCSFVDSFLSLIHISGVKVITMELGEPDESGRRSTHEVEGSEHIIPCDLVVAAIGQKVDFSVLDEKLNLTSGQHQSTIGNVLITGRCV